MGMRGKVPDPAYTSENICRAMGMDGFADDPLLSQARQAVRLLLLPSFHNEACLSFVRTEEEISLSIVAAQSRVWQEDGHASRKVPAREATGRVSPEDFEEIVRLLEIAAQPVPPPRFAVLDGMPVHSLLWSDGKVEASIRENVAYRESYLRLVAQAITTAWNAIGDPAVRNVLRDAGEYVDVDFPEQAVPPPRDR